MQNEHLVDAFETAWEAFTERAAIFEYDGGLDRMAALFKAFKMYFSGDCTACMEIAKQAKDGRAALYEYLERLNRCYLTAIQGRYGPRKAPEVQTGKAPENPPKLLYCGLGAIKIYLDRKIKLIGRYESGAGIAAGDDYLRAFTDDLNIVKSLMSGAGDAQGRARGTRIQRFDFRPADYGFLCLDIDIKNGKNGIKDFYALLESWGKAQGQTARRSP
jgi:hypothetical protein